MIAVVTVHTLGATGITAATLAGQLGASVALDKAVVLGLAEREISVGRVAGLALLAATWSGGSSRPAAGCRG